ncbi:MAG: glycosyl hydrolase [Chloroflexi bacterium HGW-Chloroflexi-4]|nr:MAG: glycosyl hydrolase [Chloroflexi bacterium HGW-Chloroflexi-4]
MADKINEIISQMMLEEKAALCIGASNWTTTPIKRLGVPEMFVADGPHGLRRQPSATDSAIKSLPATCFPTASLLASTWDVDLIRFMGEALAEECIAQNVDVILGPGVNMKRSPLCGRNFEYFSEDPYLAGEIAVAFINGVQSKGVGTSLKHYAANNQEYQRLAINAEIDERTLREIYLPAFEKAVKQANPWTVMCSYNKINGILSSQNPYLLDDILKNEWGFEGLVVSDWGAVRDRTAALQAGLDWEMPGPRQYRVNKVVEAVENGILDLTVLDESVRRILKIVFKAAETPKTGEFDAEAHHDLARKIASEGMVLLKNNGILPLKSKGKIAVIGHAAKEAHFQGGGSSHINPTRVAVPLDELKKAAPEVEFIYCAGYPADDSAQPHLIEEAVKLAKNANIALLYIALPTFKESEGYDRPDMDLTQHQIKLIQAVTGVQPNSVVILNNGSPIAVSAWMEHTAAILEAYMMGQAGGAAVADILFGKVNPSGRLAETFPLRLEDTPAFTNWPGDMGVVRYGEGFYIGYRHYDVRKMAVSFPFGFGLSYTTFEYKNPCVDKSTFNDVDGVKVSVEVTNTGKMTGKETGQVYVHDCKSTLHRPVKELKAFAKVELQPGETKKVTLKLDFRAFAFYHPEHKQWITEDGEFDILIGTSAEDICQTLTVTLKSTLDLPSLLDFDSTLNEWMQDPRGYQVLSPMYDQIEAAQRRRFGGQGRYADKKEAGAGLGVADIMDMVGENPLMSAFAMMIDEIGKPPEVMVEELLAKVHALK